MSLKYFLNKSEESCLGWRGFKEVNEEKEAGSSLYYGHWSRWDRSIESIRSTNLCLSHRQTSHYTKQLIINKNLHILAAQFFMIHNAS